MPLKSKDMVEFLGGRSVQSQELNGSMLSLCGVLTPNFGTQDGGPEFCSAQKSAFPRAATVPRATLTSLARGGVSTSSFSA